MMTTLTVAAPISQASIKPKHYVLALDGVRCLAILIVVLRHTGFGASSAFLPLRLIGTLIKISGGVPLFFIISGYLITGILLEARSSENRYRNFIVRRALRIFPLYFAYLSLAIGLTWLFTSTHLHNIWIFVFYIQNMFPDRVNQFGAILPVYHLWTLGVQEQFYFLWPFVIWSCSSLRRVRGLCWTILVCSFLLRAFLTIHMGDSVLADRLMPTRACEICLGALLAVERYNKTWISHVLPKLMLPLATLLIVLACTRIEEKMPGLVLVEGTVALLAACLLAAALVPNSLTARILSLPLFTTIGRKYSYGLFILHPAVILFCEKVLHLNHTTADSIERTVFTLCASLLLAMLSYHFFEKPFLVLKRFFAEPPRKRRFAATSPFRSTSPINLAEESSRAS